MQVWLGLGSNIDREQHLSAAVKALAKVLQSMQCSPVFESESVIIKSDNFYNMVVTGSTHLSLFELSAQLKQIEADNGRYDPDSKALPLDVDLLMYGEQVGSFERITLPHQGILSNAYVLQPLALLSPSQQHPVEKKTFAKLWQEAKIDQHLWQIASPWLSP